jgi:hypothetical protein
MLCYAVLCYDVICYAILYYAVLCYAVLTIPTALNYCYHCCSTFRDVASLVCDMTICPANGRQYSLSMVQNAMRQIHYSVSISKSAKKQVWL